MPMKVGLVPYCLNSDLGPEINAQNFGAEALLMPCLLPSIATEQTCS